MEYEPPVNEPAMKAYDPNTEHPSPEQLLLRQAVKLLTPKQKKIWELYNYDRLTQDKIADRLKISQPVVAKHIKAIRGRITRYCTSNKGLIDRLREAVSHEEE